MKNACFYALFVSCSVFCSGPADEEKAKCENIEVEFQAEFIRSMLEKIDYPALVDSARSLGYELPPTYSRTPRTKPTNFTHKVVKKNVQTIFIFVGSSDFFQFDNFEKLHNFFDSMRLKNKCCSTKFRTFFICIQIVCHIFL